ncbi:DUF4260 domain-containing protein [Propylenella binzhouense]|uniref:DUF4260 family protein n=1 Tax=Propylenella binzhouense TaxID=2555902 RepID=A0A964WU98_9HYPH|nr:DUF4260 domain-containing protein [Propylenella binzhouense]MYZ48831.1 DUF4260 family protein [Propylenella binzhouense]
MHPRRVVTLPLRLEGLFIAAIALFVYAVGGTSWWLFALLFLVPDLSMLCYLAGPGAGAVGYNAVHTYAAPILLGAAGWFGNHGMLITLALIWTAHIGIDRALGFGLKQPTGFRDTHLGRIGRG